MADKRRTVRIEQPTANKVTVFALAAVAVFVAMAFISRIDAALFQAGLALVAIAICVYAYRAIGLSAIADESGITVTNLRHTTRHRWPDVDALAVGPVPRGPGTGIAVQRKDGTSVPVEASWGAWFEGKHGAANTVRCESIVASIAAMRDAPAAPAPEPEPESPADPLSVRPMTPADAPEAAAVLAVGWRETYGELLTHQALYERDADEDAATLVELSDGSIPMSGGFVVERDGDIVGLSVFGPADPRRQDLEGYVELFMLYLLQSESESRASTRLMVRTYRAIRATGAGGAVAHVHAGQRTLTRRLEALGIKRADGTTEQNWYGLPVKVVEFRRAFTYTPTPDMPQPESVSAASAIAADAKDHVQG
ncbi:MAG: hypothetical protein ACR2NG_07015 [Acidimicrobiia bacterium]